MTTITGGNAYIIVPATWTDAMVTSSTVPEPDTGEAVWAVSIGYTTGQRVYLASNHVVYERLGVDSGVTTGSPDTDATHWAPAGRTNKWGMFDRTSGTLTTTDSPLSTVTLPGQSGGLHAEGLVGAEAHVVVKSSATGSVVYDETFDLDDTVITSVYDWFFVDRVQKTTLTLVDLPDQFYAPQLTFEITGDADVSCDALRVGRAYNLGVTLDGAAIELIDFSKKETDGYAVTDVTEGPFSKRLRCKIITDQANFNALFNLLASVRAVPVVYIASTKEGLETLTVVGWSATLTIDAQFDSVIYANLEVEGISLR